MTTLTSVTIGDRPPLAGYDPEVWRSGRAGWVHSWDMSIGVDGPGCRFVLFTAGCPLRCQYCANPDTWSARGGKVTLVDEVVKRIKGYKPALIAGGGGVTISGGEPMAQPKFITNVLGEARSMGLHTALDTSGIYGDLGSDELLDNVSLFLLDIKSYDPATYKRVTGQNVEPTLRFARRLAEKGKPINLRYVLVPGLTDAPENVDGVAEFAAGLGNVERVDVLAYHTLGLDKYKQLGQRYRLEGVRPPTWEQVEEAKQRFAGRGLTVS